MLALLRARGLTSVDTERLADPGMAGLTLAERIEPLLAERLKKHASPE